MKIAIIGAGPSGLVAAKELKEASKDFEIKIFEKQNSIGGIFLSSYPGLQLVNNPYLISFSDFLPIFSKKSLKMESAEEYVDYLNRYVTHFNLGRFIQFNSQVIGITFKGNKRILKYQHHGKYLRETFDYVVVCSGSNQSANQIDLPGQERFKGRILHSQDIRDIKQFKDKRVVFIGLGETGSDLISIAAKTAKKVIASVRRWPGYFIPRYHDGKPTDLDTSILHHSLPRYLDQSRLGCLLKIKRRIESMQIQNQQDKSIQLAMDDLNHAFEPISKVGPFHRITTKSDGFIRAYLKDKDILYPGIKMIREDSILFENDTSVSADMIVLCTGYKPKVDFLPKRIAENFKSNQFYYHMFPVDEEQICFLGFLRPGVGSIPAISELQARYLAQILTHRLSLPSKEEQLKSIETFQTMFAKQFAFDFERVSHLVDFYIYVTHLAKTIVVMPKQLPILLRNPLLWFKINTSCMCPAIFRLYGHGAKPEEAKKILRQLPTVSKTVLLIEFITFIACKCFYLLKPQRK